LQLRTSHGTVPHILEEEVAGPDTAHSVLTVSQDHKSIYCPERDLSRIQSFSFDHVYQQLGVRDTQLVEGSGLHLVDSLMQGENSSMFVVGGTAVGKSIVVEGRATSKPSGLMAQIVGCIFHRLAQNRKKLRQEGTGAAREICHARVSVSWCQLNDEPKGKTFDLLSTAVGQTGPKKDLVLREHEDRQGVHVPGLLEIQVSGLQVQ
jgi:hypothetical protein